MNAKLLSFDIAKAKDGISTLEQLVQSELVNEIENQADKIIDEFFNEIDQFAQMAMEQSSAQQQIFLNELGEQLNSNEIKKDSLNQLAESIENRDVKITQQLTAEEEKIAAEDKAEQIYQIKEKIEIGLEKIEIAKITAENALIEAENSFAEFERNAKISLANSDATISDLSGRLEEHIKAVELKNHEISLLKDKIEIIKKSNADIESQNRILLSEIKIEKRELEFIENKFLSERNTLNDKIDVLQKQLDSSSIESELLKKEKMSIEFEHIQSKKALEHSNELNASLKQELENKEASVRERESEIKNKESEIRSKDIEIRKIQEKAYQNDAIQANRIQLLESKLQHSDATYSKTIEELEDKFSDSLNLVHAMEREKNDAFEAVKRIEQEMTHLEGELQRSKKEAEASIKALYSATDEKHNLTERVQILQVVNTETEHRNKLLSEEVKNLSEQLESSSEQVATEKKSLEAFKKKAAGDSFALQSQIDDLEAKLNDAQKQKELFIANRLNSTLQVKRDTYTTDKSQGRVWLLKPALIVASAIILLIIGYFLFSHYYAPMVQTSLKGEIGALNAELESKSKYIDSMTKQQQQLTAKLDDLTSQVNVFKDKVGENITKLEETQVSMIESHQKNTPDMSAIPETSDKAKAATLPVGLNTVNTSIITDKLIESVYFESGSSGLDEKEINKIKAVAEHYNKNPYVFIRLEGHTDDKMFRFPMFHQYNNNLGLSIARAAEVSRLLVQYGMDTRQISIVGLSDMYPLVPNNNSEHRELNRRVEIKVTGKH